MHHCLWLSNLYIFCTAKYSVFFVPYFYFIIRILHYIIYANTTWVWHMCPVLSIFFITGEIYCWYIWVCSASSILFLGGICREFEGSVPNTFCFLTKKEQLQIVCIKLNLWPSKYTESGSIWQILKVDPVNSSDWLSLAIFLFCLNFLCIYYVHDDAYKQSVIERRIAVQVPVVTGMLGIFIHDSEFCLISHNNLGKRNVEVHNLPYIYFF